MPRSILFGGKSQKSEVQDPTFEYQEQVQGSTVGNKIKGLQLAILESFRPSIPERYIRHKKDCVFRSKLK